jgi:VanZ family protein
MCLLAIGVVFGLSPGHKRTELADSVQTFGHFGFFGLLALVVATGAPWLHPVLARRASLPYLLGLAVTIGAGGLLEFGQEFVPLREPSWGDVAFDSLGAVAGLALLIAAKHYRSSSVCVRRLAILAACVLVAALWVAVEPLARCARDYVYRDQAYPRLLEFDQAWATRFLWRDDGSVDVQACPPPTGWPADAGADVAQVILRPDDPFPGFGVTEPYSDWRHAAAFAMDVFNPSPVAVPMVLRIQDFAHNDDYYDRFNRELQIQPGFQTLRVTVSDIQHGPRHRQLNLAQVDGVKLFLVRPTETVRLYAGNMRLE